MKKYLAFAAGQSCLLLCLFFSQGCQTKNNMGVTVNVTTVSPRQGNSGTFVTITGTGFLTDTTQEHVTMGFINAPIIAASSTQLVVAVPVNKDSATVDSVLILVNVQAVVRGSGYFTYENANVGSAQVSTFAGTGTSGSTDGPANQASFGSPENGVFDKSGNLYVADYGNNEIRKVTPNGTVSTFAGNTAAGYQDGPASQAQFSAPSGVCFDTKGNLYVSDELNNRIRKIDPSGNVTTVAGTGTTGYTFGSRPALTSNFDRPIGIAYDSISNMLIVADSRNNVVRAISLGDGTCFTLAGPIDGPTDAGSLDEVNGNGLMGALFNSPRGIALYTTGSSSNEYLFVYVADYGNNKIREIVSVGNLETNLNGEVGTGGPSGINTYTLAGNSANQSGFTNGGGPAASFYGPNSLCFGFSTHVLGGGGTPILFIGDASNHAIRYALGAAGNTAGSQINFQTVAGTGIPGLVNGTYAQAQFEYPDGVAYNPVDGNLYVIEFGNNDIRKILLH
jgi:IPT/TIG domain/NHL repeat